MELTRRTLLRGLAGAALLAGTPRRAAAEGPDLGAARREGKLVVWHPDQEADVVKFLKEFSEKFGIQTEYQRLLPGLALPKLEAELRAGTNDLDVWWMSDVGIMHDQMKKGRLMPYVSPQMKAYPPEHKSSPEGYWTTYYINIGPIMYAPKFVKKEDAPRTWADLLNPRWKGQVGFQDASAGTQYAWWYLLRDILPPDYFDRLAQNQPRAYSSSTQQLQDLLSGELKIGGKVSIFQYTKAVRQGQQIDMVFPPEGTPANIQVAGIMSQTKRPNAAKVFMDYFLSKEGQQTWNEIQGSYSARPDVAIKELPKLQSLKVLFPKNIEDYSSPDRHKEFSKLWSRVAGLR